MNKQNSFQTARLKLTAWYVLIIMTLTILFSLVIYTALATEVVRFENVIRFVIERGLQGDNVPLIPDGRRPALRNMEPANSELVAETKQHILTMLILANAGILVAASGLGYLLAGRTLKPIKDMVDEQNRFITDASHELKTPLTALRSEFEVAMLDGKKIPHKSAVELIRSGFEEIVGLQRLTENLMELTRLQKRKNITAHGDVSLLEIIESALKNVIPLAKQKHIVIQNEIDDYILDGESSSLGELFTILLDNAIKYSPNNKDIKIASRKSDHHIYITISDQGIGIDEKDMPHIFDRFYRADKSRSKISGHGLGLSIAKEIVKSHKGAISVKSNPGQGTTFTVKLPLRKTA